MARAALAVLLLALVAGSAMAAYSSPPQYKKSPPAYKSPPYSSPPYKQPKVSVFKFIVKATNQSSLDLIEAPASNAGDRLFVTWDVLDTYYYRKIGYETGACTVLADLSNYCDFTLVAPYGTLQLVGLSNWTLTNNRLTVAGGTGKYAYATGYVDLKTLFAIPTAFNFTFLQTFYVYLYNNY